MKLFQYDKKVWCGGGTDHTLQFGIIGNRTLLYIIFGTSEKNCRIFDGISAALFILKNSLFSVDFHAYNCSLSLNFLEGWDM